ncbi:MAG: hypothetical protein IJ943_00845 [Akkermansia sp.]|nr:hypothetical protein [Akkermansia sp.]
MNYHLSLLPVIAALLLSCCAERQLNADQAAEYARYEQWLGTVAAKLRSAAAKAAKIEVSRIFQMRRYPDLDLHGQ